MRSESEEKPRNFISETLEAAFQNRVKEDITIEEMVREIGLSQITISRLRRGDVAVIQARTIQKLAAYFRWSLVEAGMAVWYSDQLVPRKKPRSRRENG